MTRYSIFSLARNALTGHRNWPLVWRSPEPRASYQVIIIGAGGHGLATAFHLARDHGMRNIAVLEKGWLGGGNTGRNTTVVRSNYLLPQSAALYRFCHDLWPGLSRTLNFNVMFSPRGLVGLAHCQADMAYNERLYHALRANGIKAELLDRREVARAVPLLDTSPSARHPVQGALVQPDAGTARHDAVAWGYARAADSLGVHILQQCEVTGLIREGGAMAGVQTPRGDILAPKVMIAVAGHSSVVAAMAGIRLPLVSQTLQALVSEPLKPVLDTVIMSATQHVYVSQTDKGELIIGAAADAYSSYAQRGGLAILEDALRALVDMFPSFGRLRLMRHWGGIVDIAPDASPILGLSPVPGLYLNCGWGTGGFKAIPGSGVILADTIAHDRPHPLAAPFALDRFGDGRLIDENAAAGVVH